MVRKPFFEALWENTSYSWVAAVIGAVSLYLYFSRNRSNTSQQRGVPRTRSVASAEAKASAASEKETLWGLFKAQKFLRGKLCIAWETLYDGTQWRNGAKELLTKVCSTADVYVMCNVAGASPAEAKERILKELANIPGIVRHKILFCSTMKGYEAFSRQISPSLVVLHDPTLANFLHSMLPYIILVEDAAAKDESSSIPSDGSGTPSKKSINICKAVSVKTFDEIPF